MKSLLFLLLVILLVDNSASGPISASLNAVLQEKCGKISYHRKVINGETGISHPWATTILVQQNDTFLQGPGTIISPRHVIAFNVILSENGAYDVMGISVDVNGTCDGDHLILPPEITRMFDVEYEFKNRENHVFRNTVAQIFIVNGCKSLSNENLMILELRQNLQFSRNRRSACVSHSPKNWENEDHFSVFGVNSSGTLLTGEFAPSECSTPQYPFSCATAVNKSQGLCQGDFGGSAVIPINTKYTVVGLYADGNVDCASDPTQFESYQFINIGYFHKEICKLTGVCSLEVEATTVVPMDAIEDAEDRHEDFTTTTPLTYTAVGGAVYVTEESPTLNTTDVDYYATEPSTRSSSEEHHTGTIIAEKFEKLKLNGSCSDAHKSHVKNIHIHLHLKK